VQIYDNFVFFPNMSIKGLSENS